MMTMKTEIKYCEACNYNVYIESEKHKNNGKRKTRSIIVKQRNKMNKMVYFHTNRLKPLINIHIFKWIM